MKNLAASDPAGMAHICSKLGMIDVMLHHHGSDDIVTYARRRKRLDYATCTTKVTKAIENMDMNLSIIT